MKVLVTGASGFVGSHTVRALLAAGHEVRAAARSPERIRRALARHGCAGAVDVVTVEVTAPAQVRAALTGCDAVVHAAAVYSLDARRRREMLRVNPLGTEVVLGQAHRLDLDPIVHVSSFAALLPARRPLTPRSPVGDPPVAYGRSKARAEQVARRWQAAGAPVTIIYPGMVWGPQDPADGESTLLARAMLGRLIPFRIPGAVPIVDVRDLAAVHAAALTRGAGPRRYLAVAARYPLVEVQRVVSRTVGRRLPRPAVPPRAMLAAGRLAQVAQRVLPIRLPFGHEGPWTAIHCPPVDASATIADLGVQFRPPEDTVRDTVHWLTTRLPRSETTGDR